MARLPGVQLTRAQAVNIFVTSSLGVISVVWVAAVLWDTISLVPDRITFGLLITTGVLSGLAPWGIRVAETVRGQIVLLYLSISFLTGIVIIGALAPENLVFAGLPALGAFCVGGTVVYFSSASHRLFVGIWLSMLAMYVLGLAGFVDTISITNNLFHIFVGLGMTIIIIGTHQTLIGERAIHL